MTDRPRILVLEGAKQDGDDLWHRCQHEGDVTRVLDTARGLAMIQSREFDAVFADTTEPSLWGQLVSCLQAEHILDSLSDGVAVVTPDLQIIRSNPAFDQWCGGNARGRSFYEALGSPEILGPDYCPFHTALAGKRVSTRLHCRENRYLELQITPVLDPQGKVVQLISLSRDATALVQQQQKLNALHQAGNELAGLDANQIAEMSVGERVELLKQNIRRLTHDLLKYDVIEIRLLDPQSGRLDPLLQEGMTPEAASRVLYARPEGQGTTGFVAATGKSYLCPDTVKDPLYLPGSPGARSSLTVPLTVQDKVIGTFNVESPKPNALGEEDLQFAEIFCREIAASLHTLELLTAEKLSATSQSVEAINREVALPVDEILTAATSALDRYIGHAPELGDKLRQILAAARSIKQCIQKVGQDLAPPRPSSAPGQAEHPRLRGMRVLVADNDERVRRSAHGLLGRHGCIVETARDGKEALTMARLSTYDAILADIRLPDLTGYDMFHQLRQCQPKARVILMTAYGYDPSHAIVKARQEGLRHVLYKPFRVDQLFEALENSGEAEAGRKDNPT